MVVPNSSTEAVIIGTPTTKVAATRLVFSLSCTAAITTSSTEINEVSPANTSEPKNSRPISAPAGAWLMMVGNAIKARPMPPAATSPTCCPLAVAIKPSAANTPIPASNSKLLLANATTMPVPVKSESRFM